MARDCDPRVENRGPVFFSIERDLRWSEVVRHVRDEAEMRKAELRQRSRGNTKTKIEEGGQSTFGCVASMI